MIIGLRATKQEILDEYGSVCLEFSHSSANAVHRKHIKELSVNYYYLEKDECAFSAISTTASAKFELLSGFIERGDSFTIQKLGGAFIYIQTKE